MFHIEPGHLSEFVRTHRESESVWLMHHIPKTAGSSLAAEMNSAVGADKFINLVADYGLAGANYTSSLDALTAQAVDRATGPNPVRVMSGHLGAAHVDRLVAAIPNLKVVSFTRHPATRVISEYNYCCSPQHPLAEQFQARYPTIDAYLAAPGEMNKTAHMMFGTDRIDPAEAIARMKARYTMIGMQERYPASFLLLSALIWAPALPQVQERVSAKKVDADPDLVKRILAVNQLDLALYDSVQAVYARMTPQIWQSLAPAPAQ